MIDAPNNKLSTCTPLLNLSLFIFIHFYYLYLQKYQGIQYFEMKPILKAVALVPAFLLYNVTTSPSSISFICKLYYFSSSYSGIIGGATAFFTTFTRHHPHHHGNHNKHYTQQQVHQVKVQFSPLSFSLKQRHLSKGERKQLLKLHSSTKNVEAVSTILSSITVPTPLPQVNSNNSNNSNNDNLETFIKYH